MFAVRRALGARYVLPVRQLARSSTTTKATDTSSSATVLYRRMKSVPGVDAGSAVASPSSRQLRILFVSAAAPMVRRVWRWEEFEKGWESAGSEKARKRESERARERGNDSAIFAGGNQATTRRRVGSYDPFPVGPQENRWHRPSVAAIAANDPPRAHRTRRENESRLRMRCGLERTRPSASIIRPHTNLGTSQLTT